MTKPFQLTAPVTPEHDLQRQGASMITKKQKQAAQLAAHAKAAEYLTKARADKAPITMAGLKGAIKQALIATLGPPPKRVRSKVPVKHLKRRKPPAGS